MSGMETRPAKLSLPGPIDKIAFLYDDFTSNRFLEIWEVWYMPYVGCTILIRAWKNSVSLQTPLAIGVTNVSPWACDESPSSVKD